MSGRVIRAAGGVLWRSGGAGLEVAVVHRPRYDDWSLPKGKAARGEHPLATACREVWEETGVRPVIGPRLPSQRYRSPRGPKVVHYWAMSGPDTGFTPSAEIDRVAWLSVPHARRVLTYTRDVVVLEAFTRIAGVDAVALLVRQASADGAAGLDRRGRQQAHLLGGVLPSFAPSRLVCDPAPVCRHTLTPLATRLRLDVGPRPAPDDPCAEPPAGPHWIRQVTGAGGATVACVRGRVVRQAIAALSPDGRLAPSTVQARKASVWALFFRAGRLAAADYYPRLTGPDV